VAPLYCIHPSGGSILGYRPLADAMIGLRPVCGVQSRSMIDPSRASVSIDAMAADYVDLLRAHRPGGPYHLLGWSMGGLIAARMAEIFERSGESVAFLGLVDAQFGSGPRRASRATAREATALDHLASFAAMAGVEIESRLTAADREDLARSTSQLDARELFVHAASWGQARGFWSDVSPELLRFLHEDREASFTAIEAFAPGRLRAPIHVWWCRETVEREGGPPCDWPAVTSGAARVEIVDGDHESIIRDPLAHAQIIDALAGANRERRQA
jgi:thioesterase domain-containing protein